MMKRTPKTRTATTRQLTQELESVKGGVLYTKWPTIPTRFPLDPTADDGGSDDDEKPTRG